MTRKLVRFVLPLVILSVAGLAQTGNAAAAPAAAPAASAPAPTTATPGKIGVIQIQQAIVATNEGQRDFQALDKKFEPKRTELQTLQKEIEDLQKQMQTQGDKLNDQARTEMAKNLESKQKTLQRNAQDAQDEYQSQSNEIAQRIGGKLIQVVDKYAKDNNYSMILDASNPEASPIIWAADSTNVTREIVDLYNAQSGVPAPPSPTGAVPRATTPKTGAAVPPKPAAAATPKKPQ